MIPGNLIHTHLASKKNQARLALSILANTANYNLYNATKAAGWNGTTSTSVQVTVNSGVYVYSTNTSLPAMDTGGTWPAGSTITLINNGFIIGGAGAGGNGYNYTAGGAGGPGFKLQYTVKITNNGTIAGGGGGGGAGGTALASGGNGGNGQSYNSAATAGGATLGGTAGGAGGTAGNNGKPGVSAPVNSSDDGSGGGGGGWGSAGGHGGNADEGFTGMYYLGLAGGAGGSCVVGNSYAVWNKTGTRYGALT